MEYISEILQTVFLTRYNLHWSLDSLRRNPKPILLCNQLIISFLETRHDISNTCFHFEMLVGFLLCRLQGSRSFRSNGKEWLIEEIIKLTDNSYSFLQLFYDWLRTNSTGKENDLVATRKQSFGKLKAISYWGIPKLINRCSCSKLNEKSFYIDPYTWHAVRTLTRLLVFFSPNNCPNVAKNSSQ